MCGRKQFVEYDGNISSAKELRCGVPQGSNLGPLLFLLYINDLAHVSPNLFAILFADDSNFFCTGKNVDDLIDTANTELKSIVSWLNANKMSLNVDKTHYMIFAPKAKIVVKEKEIIINGSIISEVKTTKFLGVIIDSKLNWMPHIDYISTKVSKNIGIITKARRLFDNKTLLTLYYSFVFPYFNYCIHLWGSTFQSYLDKLVVLQKKVVRIIAGAKKRVIKDDIKIPAISAPLFINLEILTLKNLYEYNIGLLMYKYHHGWLPNVLNFFKKNKDKYKYLTRQAECLEVPSFTTEIGIRSFRFQAVKIWNSIYKFLNVDNKIGTFKKYLKNLLIKKNM